MVHHTASPPSWDGQRDADYIAVGDEDAPISNLYIERSGTVWVIAAGATNTNGKGHDYWGSGVPDNSMNSYAIGCEAGNDGIGEQWSDAQIDAYIDVVRALCVAYGIVNGCVRGHYEWSPDRKIDPAGNSPYANGGASWDMDRFRTDCRTGDDTQPIPLPGDDMAEKICVRDTDGFPWVTDFASYAIGITEDMAARGRDRYGYQVDRDGGPYQLDEQDTDLLKRIQEQQ